MEGCNEKYYIGMIGVENGYLDDSRGAWSAMSMVATVAVLDFSNWRGSAPVFCGTPKGEGFGEGACTLLPGGLDSELEGLSPH